MYELCECKVICTFICSVEDRTLPVPVKLKESDRADLWWWFNIISNYWDFEFNIIRYFSEQTGTIIITLSLMSENHKRVFNEDGG